MHHTILYCYNVHHHTLKFNENLHAGYSKNIWLNHQQKLRKNCTSNKIDLINRLEVTATYHFCLSNAIHCMGQNIKSLAACVCVCVCAHRFWGWISRKWLQIEVRLQWDTNRKWHMADGLVTWPMTSRDLERSRSWPRYIKCPLSRKWLEIETRLQ